METLVALVARRHGLSHAELNALAVVEGNAGPMAAGEIGAAMHITTGTMTSVLDTLERKGYVQRVRDPEDRRRVLVDVTPAAQEVLDVLLPEVAHTATQALAEILADELEALRRTLGRISEAIAALPDDLERSTVRRTPPHLRRG